MIPTLNGHKWLCENLDKFLGQEYAGTWNMLIIDSGSTDDTLALFRGIERVQTHTIAPSSFGHGRTRNLAVSLSQSDLLLFTVQDARPRHQNWLNDMVSALQNSQADGICGGQAVPHEADKNPLAWYRPIQESVNVKLFSSEVYEKATPLERMQMCRWDNVNAIYLRDSLVKVPFPEVSFAEDIAWSKACLESGGIIGYADHTKIWHYHHHTVEFTKKRTWSALYWQHQHFGALPPLPKAVNGVGMMRALKILVWNSRILNPRKIWRWLKYNWETGQAAHRAGLEFKAAYAGGPHKIDQLYHTIVSETPLAPNPAR